jgi:hypothetical protein
VVEAAIRGVARRYHHDHRPAGPPIPDDVTAATGGSLAPALPDTLPLATEHATDPPRPLVSAGRSRHPDPPEHNLDAGVGEDRVEQGRVLPVAIADEEAGAAAGVVGCGGWRYVKRRKDDHVLVPCCLDTPGILGVSRQQERKR